MLQYLAPKKSKNKNEAATIQKQSKDTAVYISVL